MTNEVLARIAAAAALPPDDARAALHALWDEVSAPLPRCLIAHHVADLHDDVRDELTWDLRALANADLLTDDEVLPGMSLRALYPSLHLNVGDAYRRAGDLDQARAHARRAAACVDALPQDGYGKMIRAGVAHLVELVRGDGD